MRLFKLHDKDCIADGGTVDCNTHSSTHALKTTKGAILFFFLSDDFFPKLYLKQGKDTKQRTRRNSTQMREMMRIVLCLQ